MAFNILGASPSLAALSAFGSPVSNPFGAVNLGVAAGRLPASFAVTGPTTLQPIAGQPQVAPQAVTPQVALPLGVRGTYDDNDDDRGPGRGRGKGLPPALAKKHANDLPFGNPWRGALESRHRGGHGPGRGGGGDGPRGGGRFSMRA